MTGPGLQVVLAMAAYLRAPFKEELHVGSEVAWVPSIQNSAAPRARDSREVVLKWL